MAIVYFTNNASTGAGTLAEAVKNAQPGDVIRPDETVFERGSTIEIVLAATLTVDKNLTLDGGPFRVCLNGGGARRCAIVSANVTANFIGFDFVRGDAASSNGGGLNGAGTTDVTCIRCGFYGCVGANGGGAYLTGVSALRDCVVTGCRATTSGGGIYLFKSPTLNGVTVAGCVAPTGSGVRFVNATVDASNSILCDVISSNALTYRGCVVNVATSQIGFVAPPPDNLTAENWDTNAWQNWDLRLLDDASPTPSPYRDAGDVDAATQYDFDGNFRGRKTNGVATCSPGAYETIQAGLFWIGRDATGAEVVSPSFLTSDGWAASRFATVSGDAAPQTGQTFFIGRDAAFVDAPPDGSAANVGGGVLVSTGSGAGETTLNIGVGATFGVASSVNAERLGADSLVKLRAGSLTVDGRTSTPDATEPLRFVNWTGGRLRVVGDLHLLEALDVPPGATLDLDGATLRVETLTVADGATVAFSGVDAVLSASQSATVGGATLSGAGYFATPPGTDLSAASFAETVRACDSGAAVAAFAATATGPKTARLEWSATNAGATVCAERETATGWEVVDARASSTLETTIITPGVTRFRLFDGEDFLYDVAWYLTGDQFTVAGFCYTTTTNETSSVEYATRGRIVATSNNGLIYYGQSVTFIQRIANAFTGELLKNDDGNVTAVKYSLYKRETGLFSNTADATAIFENRDAPTTCVLEAPQTSEAWNEDGEPVEYNFVLTPPNSTLAPFLPSPGEYFLRVSVELSTGNPIVSIFEFSVL